MNAAWEMVQCGIFFDMWSWPVWDAAIAMIGAILADVVIVLSIIFLASVVAAPEPLFRSRIKQFLLPIAVGLPISFVLEWIPRTLGWWEYGPAMPTFSIAGITVGVTPILQITLLPAISLHLANRTPRRRPA